MSALSICIVLRAFVVVISMRLYLSLGSRVSPSIFGLMSMYVFHIGRLGCFILLCLCRCVLMLW